MSVRPISGLNGGASWRARVRIEFQSGQVQTERGNPNGGFAVVHPVNLRVECGPDQFATRLAASRAEGDQPAQGLHQEDAGPACEIEDGLPAAAPVGDLVKNEGDQRQPGIEDVGARRGSGGRSDCVGKLLVDGADQFHGDHVELVRKERPLSRLRIHRVEEVRHPDEVRLGR